MGETMKAALIGALAIASLAPAAQAAPGAPGHSHNHLAVGKPGNPKQPSRAIQVIMTEEFGLSTYEPKVIKVKRNEQIRFILKNTGKLRHEFMLGTTQDNLKHAVEMKKNPTMEHDDDNGADLKPGENRELLWRFTTRGTFEYGCLIPGHREEGMVGTIIVE